VDKGGDASFGGKRNQGEDVLIQKRFTVIIEMNHLGIGGYPIQDNSVILHAEKALFRGIDSSASYTEGALEIADVTGFNKIGGGYGTPEIRTNFINRTFSGLCHTSNVFNQSSDSAFLKHSKTGVKFLGKYHELSFL